MGNRKNRETAFDYDDCRFAMLTSSNDVLAFSLDGEIYDYFRKHCSLSDEELEAVLENYDDDRLCESLTMCDVTCEEVIDQFDINDGERIMELLEEIGYSVKYDALSEGPHGHDCDGVYYVE